MIIEDWERVVSGVKKQMRYIVKPTHTALGLYRQHLNYELPYDGENSIGVIRSNERDLYTLTHTYRVRPQVGRPALHWFNDEYGNPIVTDIDRLFYNDKTSVYDKAKTTPFLSTSLPDADMYLLNEIGEPFEVIITKIRNEDVRDISEEDALLEGHKNKFSFLSKWHFKHDPSFHFWYEERISSYMWYIGRWTKNTVPECGDWDTFKATLMKRPAEFYNAWVLDLQVIRPYG